MQLQNMRLTGIDKRYYQNQLEQFEQAMITKFNCHHVEFGKQDIRGTSSICLFGERGTVTQQKHFETKAELLGFVTGYNAATRDYL